jgi:putative transposase
LEIQEQLAEPKRGWGFGKMLAHRKSQGWGWNHKKVRRVYRNMNLNLRINTQKWWPVRILKPLGKPKSANRKWPLDFMNGGLISGRSVPILKILDEFNCEG